MSQGQNISEQTYTHIPTSRVERQKWQVDYNKHKSKGFMTTFKSCKKTSTLLSPSNLSFNPLSALCLHTDRSISSSFPCSVVCSPPIPFTYCISQLSLVENNQNAANLKISPLLERHLNSSPDCKTPKSCSTDPSSLWPVLFPFSHSSSFSSLHSSEI